MYKITEILQYGRLKLKEHEIDPREARLLLAYSMGISADELIKWEECEEKQYHLFEEVLQRRVQGEPFAYITGIKEFMKLPFHVNQHTLIPREDTEILVQKAIDICSDAHSAPLKILDMCTGSGCIAISIAKYVLSCQVDAVDVSSEALKVAKENAILNGVEVHLIESNLFEKVENQYDLIVSNPPYIISNEIDTLQAEVQSEPRIALDGGKDGLDFYRKISKEAISFLKPGGTLLFEIGFHQANEVSQILSQNNYSKMKVIKDFSGNDRVVVAKYETK